MRMVIGNGIWICAARGCTAPMFFHQDFTVRHGSVTVSFCSPECRSQWQEHNPPIIDKRACRSCGHQAA